MSFSIGSLFSKLGHSIASFFGSHQATIQAVIADAQQAAGAATAVALVTHQPANVSDAIAKVSDGLSIVSAAVTSESSAETLTQHATNLANLTMSLVNSGDIGVKDAATQSAVGAVAIKVQGVVGALETAAAAAPETTPAP